MDWIQQLQSANWHQVTGCALEAYVLGCFATAYYLVRARTGKDLRAIESGSLGARNAGRVLGKTGFAIALMGDFGKGALAVWIAQERKPGQEQHGPHQGDAIIKDQQRAEKCGHAFAAVKTKLHGPEMAEHNRQQSE